MRKHTAQNHLSRRNVLITLLLIVAPFLFLLLFSQLLEIATGKLFLDVLVSVWRLAVAYIVAALLAWVWAVSFYRGRRATVALPLFDVLQSFPTFATLPLATLFLGRTNSTVILFLVVTIVWPIFFSVISSLKRIERDWVEAVEIAGLKKRNYLRLFLWPASVPGLITGSIIGLGEGWEALVATEIIVRMDTGLGNFFQAFSDSPTITAFGILGLLLITFAVNKLLWLPLLERSHRTMEG